MINVKNGGARGGVGPRPGSLSIRKGDRAKVGKRHEAVAYHVIFNNPLRILSTERSRGSKTLRNRLAVGQVLDRCSARGGGGGLDSEFDDISGRDGDVREIVGRGGVPLVPGC